MQNEGRHLICHLCLKSLEYTYEYVEEVTIEVLRFLGLGLRLDQCGKAIKSVICKTCSENAQKCFDFKTICVSSENCINSFRNEGDDAKLDLREIYLRKNEIKNTAMSKYHTVCRLCMELVELSSCIPLNNETKDAVAAEAILRRHISELDLNIIENPHICASCNDCLHSYFTFVKYCLDVKDEIENCYKIEERNEKNQVESDSKFRFEAKNVSNYKNGCSDIDTLKNCVKNELCSDTELKIGNTIQEESQEWQIKSEVNEREEIDDVKRDIAENETDIKSYNNIKCEEISIKTEEGDIDGFRNIMLIHENSSEVPMYYCKICGHKSKWKSSIKKHMLIHKNTWEVTMYSCELCTYKSKRKSDLKDHTLIHKSASEVTVYACEICMYKSKHKKYLKQHMLVHKSVPEVAMHSCKVCTFKTKRKNSLKLHMLIHTNSSEVTTYSSEESTYKAKQKGKLEQQTFINKNALEITMYSCEICEYKSKLKSRIKKHMLIHKNTWEVTMYSCEKCTYKSKRKGDVKNHMLVHKNASEVTMHSCNVCTFKSKHKKYLKQHMLIHKNASEITMYSCEICTYKSKYKSDLKHHMLVHKNALEVYSCNLCTFKSKHKGYLKRHNTLAHKNA